MSLQFVPKGHCDNSTLSREKWLTKALHVIRQHAITWTNVDWGPWCDMASLSHNKLKFKWFFCVFFHYYFFNRNLPVLFEIYNLYTTFSWRNIRQRRIVLLSCHPQLLTLNMLNCFNDYKRCIHILYHIFNFVQQKKTRFTMEQL